MWYFVVTTVILVTRRAVFNWVSKFCVYYGFAFLDCDWLKNLAHFLNQSEVKPKPILTFSRAFSRAWFWLHLFASSSDWFIRLSLLWLHRVIAVVLILRHSIKNCSYLEAWVPRWWQNISICLGKKKTKNRLTLR